MNGAQPGAGAAVVFWVLAALTVVGALFTITRRNAVTAVMSLVGTFLGLASLYALLFAHFLAVIQVLVYAGAVMVLFVFVVMILNREEDEPWALRGLFGKGVAGAAIVYVLVRTSGILWDARTRVVTPVGELETFGTTKEVGRVLFSDYLFAFEAVSLVLVIAVVGALVLGHPGRDVHAAAPGGAGEGDGGEVRVA